MKNKSLLITAAAGVLVYLLLKRNFGNPHRSIRLKKQPDAKKILAYKFAS